jgi:hypothetical protein
VAYLKSRLETCEAHLRAHLEPDERVIAVGRCEDITARGDIDSGGAAWTFVMVTDRRLRWVPYVRLRYETNVGLDGVTAVYEQTSAHRYAMTLHHGPVRALRDVSAHRFLWFRWGNADAVRTLLVTTLAFSRRDTAAALALRAEFNRRRIVPRMIASPPRPPRPAPSYFVLRRTEDQ